MQFFRSLAVVAAMLIFALPVSAQKDKHVDEVADKTAVTFDLKDRHITEWVASLKSLEGLSAKYEDAFEDLELDERAFEDGSYANVFSQLQHRGKEAYDAFERMVRTHGFESVEQYYEATSRITAAHFAQKLADDEGVIDATMKLALEQMKLTGASEEQINEIKDQILEAKSALKEAADGIPEKDRKIVAKYSELLDNAMGMSESGEGKNQDN